MGTINESPVRVGRITSSEIVAMVSEGKAKGSLGAPFFTYIEECNMERRLGRSLTNEVSSRETTWGNVCEIRCFDLLGTGYSMSSKVTLIHPEINYWAGSPDGAKFDEDGKVETIIDFKSPFTLKSFCQLVDPLYHGFSGTAAMNIVRAGYTHKESDKTVSFSKHKSGETYYWQLVSNACITGAKYAELIVYCPLKEEIEEVKKCAGLIDGNQEPYKWLERAWDGDVPYLLKGGHYNNINIIRFEVPQADKDFLTERIIEAGKYLI